MISARLLMTTLALAFSAAPLASAAELAKKAALQNTTWQVQTINGAAPASSSPLTLTFGQQYRLYGSTGCNPFYGIYGEDDNHVAIRTAAAAPCSTSEGQDAFLGILQSTPSLTLEKDGRLTIVGAKGRMTLTRSAQPPT
jgi:heat shock protein HslJ